MNDAADSVAAIILAAGASRRLGQSKALLPAGNGISLIQRVVDIALRAGLSSVYVVIQPQDDAIRAALQNRSVNFVANPDWKEGMSSSLRHGISHIREREQIDGALILLVDQPALNTQILQSMIAAFAGGQRIVACQYDDVTGVPALIGHEFLDELMKLDGDRGARDWLRAMPERVAVIPFPGGANDIDTSHDRRRLDQIVK